MPVHLSRLQLFRLWQLRRQRHCRQHSTGQLRHCSPVCRASHCAPGSREPRGIRRMCRRRQTLHLQNEEVKKLEAWYML